MHTSSIVSKAARAASGFLSRGAVRRALKIAGTASALALVPALAHATSTGDLLSAQASTVNSTFGHGSTLEKWFYIAELIISLMLFIKSRSPLVFVGLIFMIIFTRVGFGIIG